MLTIFTPTYNRKHTLLRCYDSILQQNYLDIEWIIVDDGSTDGTSELIDSIKRENKINIKYFYQDNSGKQSAWNKGVLEASGNFFIGLDSDDELMPSALLKISKYFTLLNSRDDLIGLRCLAIRESTGKPDSSFQIGHNCIASWYDEFASRIFGERIDIFKTEVIKNYLYPVSDGIKFIPEIWFYSIISKKYSFIYLDEPVSVFHDQAVVGRLSKSSFLTHVYGHRIARRAMLKNIPIRCFIMNPIGFIKTIIRFIQAEFYVLLRRKDRK